jgi:hypothetical protein
MFPEEFVAKQVEAYTKEGDYVFDPFCGRGTTILQSLLMGRNSAGTDVNPVAYCISNAKARIPAESDVIGRLEELELLFASKQSEIDEDVFDLPEFFCYAFHADTLRSLLFLRNALDWRNGDVDRFVAALTLGSLHGEMDKSSSYFSNQMPRTISTKPRYSVRYWRRHRLNPPQRKVFDLLRAKAMYRLGGELPTRRGAVSLCDARDSGEMFQDLQGRVRLIVTSPPYLNVTRYEEDQWLRLWFLGFESKPTYRKVSRDDRHSSEANYWDFLTEAWEGIAPLLGRSAMFVCRLAGKDIPRKELTENLYETILSTFPRAYMIHAPKISRIRNRQSNNFRPGAKGCFFEMDHAFMLT